MNRYSLQPVTASCPVCYAKNARLLYSVDSGQAAQHFVLKELAPERYDRLRLHIESLWKQSFCKVVRCSSCQFCYAFPFVAGDEHFYALAFTRSAFPVWKWEHQITYEALMERKATDFKMLEIGAGDGAFVKRIAQDLSDKANILCTEYSEYGASAIRKYGLGCLSKDIRADLDIGYKAHFDSICLFQVIEHMDCLDELFERFVWLARSNASLFIATPNPKRIEFHELHHGLLDMPPNHLGRWNKETFEIIGQRHGWKVEKYEIETTERYPSKARTLADYRFLLKSQEAFSWANRIERVKDRTLHKLLKTVGLGFYALNLIPAFISLRSRELGASQWVHLRKV